MFHERKRRQRFETEALVHTDALYGLALRLTRSERDAEDLCQDTFLKAFQHFDKYTPGTNCKAWLFRILTNTFINRYRKAQRQRTVFADDMSPSPLERVAASLPDPLNRDVADQAQLFARVFGDEVSKAMDRVPVDFRIAVLLVDLYNFSYKECADIVGCPIGTVMSRLYRGRRLLQKQLYDYAVRQGIISADPAPSARAAEDGDEDNVVPFPYTEASGEGR